MMNKDVTEAQMTIVRDIHRLTDKPSQQGFERLIDLIVAVRDELRETNGKGEE
jgi:hypothetical protein